MILFRIIFFYRWMSLKSKYRFKKHFKSSYRNTHSAGSFEYTATAEKRLGDASFLSLV